MRLRHLVALLLLAACVNETPAPPPGPPRKPIILPPPSDAEERSSILNLARGASVVSRTGEAMLEYSALAAIDGDPSTAWQNPPGDLPQSVVIALPAKTRIESIGVRTNAAQLTARSVTFEASSDGVAFTPLGTVATKAEVTWQKVTPVDASFIRATLDAANGHDVRVQSLLARGRELAPPREPNMDGCWLVNEQLVANFTTEGARVFGHVDDVVLDGGSNGRNVRAEWVRGPQFGHAVLASDGRHLSAVEWHEEPIPLFAADPWFGSPCGAGILPALGGTRRQDAGATRDVAEAFLQRTGRHSLYAIRFHDDDSIDLTASGAGFAQLSRLIANHRGRIVAHEFRERDAAANHARAQREIDAIKRQLTANELARVTLVAAGSDDPRQIPASEAARELYSTVDFEVER